MTSGTSWQSAYVWHLLWKYISNFSNKFPNLNIKTDIGLVNCWFFLYTRVTKYLQLPCALGWAEKMYCCHIFSSYFNILTIFLRFHQTTNQWYLSLKITVLQQKNNRRQILFRNNIKYIVCLLFWVDLVLPTCYFFNSAEKFS